MGIKKNLSLTIVKTLSVLMLFSSVSLNAYSGEVSRNISSLSNAEADKRIKELKKSLAVAKGEKRGKIIKKIAEIENKVLERRLNSSADRR
ncbi:MAG: hypothetical protein ACRBBP_03385 [Bdellovibrionales bacterium]